MKSFFTLREQIQPIDENRSLHAKTVIDTTKHIYSEPIEGKLTGGNLSHHLERKSPTFAKLMSKHYGDVDRIVKHASDSDLKQMHHDFTGVREEVELDEAKIGDKVTITHGSQKGIVGHVGEIRKGLGGTNHTYTVDYDDNGKRQSVQVKKAHTKLVREATVDLSDIEKKKAITQSDKNTIGKIADLMKKEKEKQTVKEASIYSTSMPGRGQVGMVGKKPNASDMATYGNYHVTVKHEDGEKTYKLKDMKDSRHASNVATKLHNKDNPDKKIKDVSYKKV